MDRAHQLLSACLENDVVTVSACLNYGFSVNEQDLEGTAPLHVAAANGYETLVEFLISRGADIDLPNAYGWTALMQAARYGHTSVVSLLLRHGANSLAVNKLGIGLLSIAASSGHRSTVLLVLTTQGVPTEDVPRDSCEMTPMMSAALFGHVSVIGLLLTQGASVNCVSSTTGRSPLLLSSCNGHRQCVELLVEFGADTNWKDIRDRTALDIALGCGKSDVAAYLSEKTSSRSCRGQVLDTVDIINAVQKGDFNLAKSILQKDPSRANWSCPKTGMTPLMYAAMLGHLNIAMLLLENESDIDRQDNEHGWSALMHAVFSGKSHMVSYLLKAGSNIGLSAHDSATALDMACYLDTMDSELSEFLGKVSAATKHVLPTEDAAAGDSGKYKGASEDDVHRVKSLRVLIAQVTQRLRKSKQPVLKPIPCTTQDTSFTSLSFDTLDTASQPERIPRLSLLPFTRKPLLPSNRNVPVPLPPQQLQGYSNRKTKNKPDAGWANRAETSVVTNFTSGWQPTVILNQCFEPFTTSGIQVRKISHQLAVFAAYTRNHPTKLNEIKTSSSRHFLDVPSRIGVGQSRALSTSAGAFYCSGTIRDLLKRLHLEEYAENFEEHEVDLDTFVDLNTRDLENIGIPENSIKWKLLEVIKVMRNQTLL